MDISIMDVIGPVMIGPSSSHTAGAVRIGFVAQFPYSRGCKIGRGCPRTLRKNV